MSDTLEIFGTEYTGVAGIKATDDNDQIKTYIRPQGTKTISANGTGIDVTEYSSVDVNVSGGGSGSDYYMWQDSDGYLHYSNSALGASGYVITASTEYQEVSSGTTIVETVTTTASNAIENAMGVTIYDKAWVIYDTDTDSYYDANAFPLVAGDTYKVTIGSDVYTSTAWMDSTYMEQVVIGGDVIGWDGVTTLVCPIEAWGNNKTDRNSGGIYSTASIPAGTTIKIEHLM